MRGKGGLAGGRTVEHGITPAYAGKRARPKTPPLTPRDHPRMCGEKPADYVGYKLAKGSPPHVRGKVLYDDIELKNRGITPACAGKSTGMVIEAVRKEDHPRMCGEKNIWVVDAITSTGSPPHVRGKALLNSSKNLFSRITPACAGKRLLQSFYDTRGWDHPRMCGEKADTAAACALCWGSPPHVRGKD